MPPCPSPRRPRPARPIAGAASEPPVPAGGDRPEPGRRLVRGRRSRSRGRRLGRVRRLVRESDLPFGVDLAVPSSSRSGSGSSRRSSSRSAPRSGSPSGSGSSRRSSSRSAPRSGSRRSSSRGAPRSGSRSGPRGGSHDELAAPGPSARGEWPMAGDPKMRVVTARKAAGRIRRGVAPVHRPPGARSWTRPGPTAPRAPTRATSTSGCGWPWCATRPPRRWPGAAPGTTRAGRRAVRAAAELAEEIRKGAGRLGGRDAGSPSRAAAGRCLAGLPGRALRRRGPHRQRS